LGGQFPGWLEHETAKFSVVTEQRQNRQSEGGGFSGAGLGGADKIFAGENEGKSAELNRRGLGKTHCLHPAHYFKRKTEIIE
jgi:hypothetical protein